MSAPGVRTRPPPYPREFATTQVVARIDTSFDCQRELRKAVSREALECGLIEGRNAEPVFERGRCSGDDIGIEARPGHQQETPGMQSPGESTNRLVRIDPRSATLIASSGSKGIPMSRARTFAVPAGRTATGNGGSGMPLATSLTYRRRRKRQEGPGVGTPGIAGKSGRMARSAGGQYLHLPVAVRPGADVFLNPTKSATAPGPGICDDRYPHDSASSMSAARATPRLRTPFRPRFCEVPAA